MEEQPQDPPARAAGDQPKFFSTVNGMIAGATGLVIALGGLATAYKQIFDDDKPAVAAPADAVDQARPVAAADLAKKPDDGPPLLYEGDDTKLEFVDDQWVLTTAEGEFEYKEMYSPDEPRVVAFDKLNNAYLRWPIKGGMSEESTDGEDTWKSWIKLYPPDPAEGDAAE